MELQETAILSYRGENWEIETSDTTFKNLLERKGWVVESTSLQYSRYVLPRKAISVRGRSSVENKKPRGRKFTQRMGVE